MDVDLIPWKTKDEWAGVYEDLFSGEFSRVREAVLRITEWKFIMKEFYRPGMDCTRGLLHVALKDKDFFDSTPESYDISALQLMYSAEIMRFLNLVCDTKTNGRKISLYGKAGSLGIPDWVVNVRHQMAHRDALPTLDILRLAVKFILNWLKVHYWEVEKNEMTEVLLEDPKSVVPENFAALLEIYILLKEQLMLGFQFIRDIQDPDVRELILKINSFSLTQVKIRCKPWDVRPGEEAAGDAVRNIRKQTIERAVISVIHLFKAYVRFDGVFGVDTIEIIINRMIEDSVRYSGLRIEVWKTLLKFLHSSYKFPLMISLLLKKSRDLMGEDAYQATTWALELCQALQKRFKVEQLSDFLVREFSTRNTKQVKEINFDSNELTAFTSMIRKRKLEALDQTDEKRLTCIYMRIEDKFPDLKKVLRLKEAIFPQRWEVLELINEAVLCPNEFTEQCLTALYDILKWPFPKKDFLNLVALTKIYRGEGILLLKRKKIYSLKNLEPLIPGLTTEEMVMDES